MTALHDLLAAGAGPEETSFSADDIGRRVGQRARRRRLVTAGGVAVLVGLVGLAGVLVQEADRPSEVVVVGDGRVTTTTPIAPPRQVPVTGTVQDEPWQLIAVPAGSPGSGAMCLEVRLARGSLKSCSDWEETIAASAYDILGDRVIAGSARSSVAAVRVRFSDATEPLVIPTVEAEGFARRFFAATITTDASIAEVMALDADGDDLEPVADLGGGVLGTGQPDS